MRLKATKRVEYIWVPQILIDDWVQKGHPTLNMFSVFGEQIKSLSIQFDIKCKNNYIRYDQHIFFGTKFRGGQNLLFTVRGFFNKREYSGARLSVCVSITGLNKYLLNYLKSYWSYLWYVAKAKTRSLQDIKKKLSMSFYFHQLGPTGPSWS